MLKIRVGGWMKPRLQKKCRMISPANVGTAATDSKISPGLREAIQKI